MDRISCILISLFILFPVACTVENDGDERAEQAQAQAEVFLEVLRAGQWNKATEFVLMDHKARNRFGLPEDADTSELSEHIEQLFRAVYQIQKPGPIMSVRIDPSETGDPDLLMIQYRHGDLDGFYMRLVDGRWLYTFE